MRCLLQRKEYDEKNKKLCKFLVDEGAQESLMGRAFK
jgi:hypothetical protein